MFGYRKQIENPNPNGVSIERNTSTPSLFPDDSGLELAEIAVWTSNTMSLNRSVEITIKSINAS